MPGSGTNAEEDCVGQLGVAVEANPVRVLVLHVLHGEDEVGDDEKQQQETDDALPPHVQDTLLNVFEVCEALGLGPAKPRHAPEPVGKGAAVLLHLQRPLDQIRFVHARVVLLLDHEVNVLAAIEAQRSCGHL